MKLWIASLAVLAACGSKSKSGYDHPVGITMAPRPMPEDDATCPLVVAGTSVAFEDETGGGALVFATTGDVAAVRRRAGELATRFNARTAGADQRLAPAPCGGCLANAVDVAGKAVATDVPTGSRVTFTAADANAAGELGGTLRMHADHLAHLVGTCEMGM